MICGTFKRHQTCDNSKRYAIAQIFELLRAYLSTQSDTLWNGWRTQLYLACEQVSQQRDHLDQQIKDKECANERLIDALASGLSASHMVNTRIMENEQAIDALKQQRLAIDKLPEPTMFHQNRFYPALAKAIKSDEETQFVLQHIKAVSFDRDGDGKPVITDIKPNFVAIAAL